MFADLMKIRKLSDFKNVSSLQKARLRSQTEYHLLTP